jgi:hypothetical protein
VVGEVNVMETKLETFYETFGRIEEAKAVTRFRERTANIALLAKNLSEAPVSDASMHMRALVSELHEAAVVFGMIEAFAEVRHAAK